MSTRSMTLVQQTYSGDRDAFIPLYRHCDGYPAEAGAALLEALKDNPRTCEDIVRRLLVGDIGEYRLATWGPEEQGDLEHVYVVRRENDAWRVTHHSLMPGSEGGTAREDYRSNAWAVRDCSLQELREIVNQERMAINGRMRACQINAEPYPML